MTHAMYQPATNIGRTSRGIIATVSTHMHYASRHEKLGWRTYSGLAGAPIVAANGDGVRASPKSAHTYKA